MYLRQYNILFLLLSVLFVPLHSLLGEDLLDEKMMLKESRYLISLIDVVELDSIPSSTSPWITGRILPEQDSIQLINQFDLSSGGKPSSGKSQPLKAPVSAVIKIKVMIKGEFKNSEFPISWDFGKYAEIANGRTFVRQVEYSDNLLVFGATTPTYFISRVNPNASIEERFAPALAVPDEWLIWIEKENIEKLLELKFTNDKEEFSELFERVFLEKNPLIAAKVLRRLCLSYKLTKVQQDKLLSIKDRRLLSLVICLLLASGNSETHNSLLTYVKSSVDKDFLSTFFIAYETYLHMDQDKKLTGSDRIIRFDSIVEQLRAKLSFQTVSALIILDKDCADRLKNSTLVRGYNYMKTLPANIQETFK